MLAGLHASTVGLTLRVSRPLVLWTQNLGECQWNYINLLVAGSIPALGSTRKGLLW